MTVSMLAQMVENAGMIFVCGNGGSAANAEHLSSDLLRLGYRAICLSSNAAVITMIANDFGYSQVFGRQLDVLARPGDLLITISCSGTSPNILEAIGIADAKRMPIYRFPTMQDDDYETAENKHLEMIHELKNLLTHRVMEER